MFYSYAYYLVLVCWAYAGTADFSIHYYTENQEGEGGGLRNAGELSFTSTPNPLQVADIFARISGMTPLLVEEEVSMPSRSVTVTDKNVDFLPYIVEVRGGGPSFLSSIPHMQPVIRSGRDQRGLVSPSLGHVIEALDENDVHLVENKDYSTITIDKDYSTITIDSHSLVNPVSKLLKKLSAKGRNVVILHDDGATSTSARRHTSDTNPNEGSDTGSDNSITPIPLTELQIASYQIGLWSAVVMVLLLLTAICSIVQMEVIPDSLLSAKFQSGRTGGKFD